MNPGASRQDEEMPQAPPAPAHDAPGNYAQWQHMPPYPPPHGWPPLSMYPSPAGPHAAPFMYPSGSYFAPPVSPPRQPLPHPRDDRQRSPEGEGYRGNANRSHHSRTTRRRTPSPPRRQPRRHIPSPPIPPPGYIDREERRLRDEASRSRLPHPRHSDTEDLNSLRLRVLNLQQELEAARLQRDHAEQRLEHYERSNHTRSSRYAPYARSQRPQQQGINRNTPGPSGSINESRDRSIPDSSNSRNRSVAPRPDDEDKSAPRPTRSSKTVPSNQDTAPTRLDPMAAPFTAPPRPNQSSSSSAPTPMAQGFDPYLIEEDDGLWQSDYSDEDTQKDALNKHKTEERNRLSRAQHKRLKAGPDARYPTPSWRDTVEEHGPWQGRVITTTGEATALLNAARSDHFALRYVRYLNTYHQNGVIPRSMGIAAILRQFATFQKMYYNNTDGNSTGTTGPSANASQSSTTIPRSSTSSGPSAGAIPNPSTTVTTSTTLTGDPGEAYPERPQHDGSGQWYDPDEVSPDDSIPILRRPVGSSTADQVSFWRSQPVQNWPAGMRLASGDLPSASMSTSVGMDAHETDVRAHALRLDTSPFRRHSSAATNIARRNYYRQFVSLFSIPGLYAQILTEIGVRRGERRVEAFPFATDNLDVFHVAAWLHDHGISPVDPLINILEEWGPTNRARIFDETRSDETGWPSFPRTFASVVDERPDVRTLRTTFRYPPLPVSAPPRLWYTATENHAIRMRRVSGATPFPPLPIVDDERDDVVMHDSSAESST